MIYEIDNKNFKCPAEALAYILGKKWIAQIIWLIGDKSMRFNQLNKALDGCSYKMLSQQLRLLKDWGLIKNRKLIEHNQTESIYKLSAKGLSLLPVLAQIITWGNEHLCAIANEPKA